MTQRIGLIEYQRSAPVRLTHDRIVAIGRAVPEIRIEPAAHEPGAYTLTPGACVGMVALPGLIVEIRPKIPIDRLFYLISWAMDDDTWLKKERVTLDADASVLEAVAPVFVRLVRRATFRGLLHSYETREESSAVMRGRLRIDDQIRRRQHAMFPLEVRYDAFTEDILENRLLLAALDLLMRLPLRSAETERSLRELRAAFHAVTPQTFPRHRLPCVTFTRLNEHYRPAVELALLILQNGSLELAPGPTTAIGLLLNMNTLFERFVHRALCDALELDERTFPRGNARLSLDRNQRLRLHPDLSWWHKGRCRFVGDVKYKRKDDRDDLYQLLAYTVAANVRHGLLIYAAGEGDPTRHDIAMINKTLHIATLDLSGPIPALRRQVIELAAHVRALAASSDSSADTQ